MAGGASPAAAALAAVGLRPSPAWLAETAAALGPNAGADAVLQQALFTDLRSVVDPGGAPGFPPGFKALKVTRLPGPLFLQVDELVDVGVSAAEAADAVADGGGGGGAGGVGPPSARRALKLALTDGVTQTAGLEWRGLHELGPAMAAGAKLVVRDVEVRRGMLLLGPANTRVLGGAVPALVALQQSVRAMQQQQQQQQPQPQAPPPAAAPAQTRPAAGAVARPPAARAAAGALDDSDDGGGGSGAAAAAAPPPPAPATAAAAPASAVRAHPPPPTGAPAAATAATSSTTAGAADVSGHTIGSTTSSNTSMERADFMPLPPRPQLPTTDAPFAAPPPSRGGVATTATATAHAAATSAAAALAPAAASAAAASRVWDLTADEDEEDGDHDVGGGIAAGPSAAAAAAAAAPSPPASAAAAAAAGDIRFFSSLRSLPPGDVPLLGAVRVACALSGLSGLNFDVAAPEELRLDMTALLTDGDGATVAARLSGAFVSAHAFWGLSGGDVYRRAKSDGSKADRKAFREALKDALTALSTFAGAAECGLGGLPPDASPKEAEQGFVVTVRALLPDGGGDGGGEGGVMQEDGAL